MTKVLRFLLLVILCGAIQLFWLWPSTVWYLVRGVPNWFKDIWAISGS